MLSHTRRPNLLLAASSALTLLASSALAHTWNEQLAVIDSNGDYAGSYGYPRGYVSRTSPAFDGLADLWQLPSLASERTSINASDALCMPTQRSQNQTSDYPRLTVAPGSNVAFKYQENGHVTLPQNQLGKPLNRGTVYIFATADPDPNETLVNVLYWNKAGTGGDKRGRLITQQDYDDQRCYQVNGGTISQQRQASYPNPTPDQPGTKNDVWCETDFQIPTDASLVEPGKTLTLYWVWDWPYQPNGLSPGLPDGKQEWYTTCSDVDVVAPSQLTYGNVTNTLTQQDPNLKAVSDYASRTVNPSYTIPSYFTWPGVTVASIPAQYAVSATAASAASASTMPSNTMVSVIATPTITSAPTAADNPNVSSTPIVLGSAMSLISGTPLASNYVSSLAVQSTMVTMPSSSATASVPSATGTPVTVYSAVLVSAVFMPGTTTLSQMVTVPATFTLPDPTAQVISMTSTSSTVPTVIPSSTMLARRNVEPDFWLQQRKPEVAGGHRYRMQRW